MLLCGRHWCDAVVWEALVRCCCVGGIGAMLLGVRLHPWLVAGVNLVFFRLQKRTHRSLWC